QRSGLGHLPVELVDRLNRPNQQLLGVFAGRLLPHRASKPRVAIGSPPPSAVNDGRWEDSPARRQKEFQARSLCGRSRMSDRPQTPAVSVRFSPTTPVTLEAPMASAPAS